MAQIGQASKLWPTPAASRHGHVANTHHKLSAGAGWARYIGHNRHRAAGHKAPSSLNWRVGVPLTCLDADGTIVFAHHLTRDELEALRNSQKMLSSLHFACCTARVGLRVSKNGLNHFYHLSDARSCPYAEETEAHLSLKVAAMEAARRAGWQADCEVSGGFDDSQQWRADVLAWKGAVRIAFEVQISNATWAQVVARQARYRAAGVRGLWLLGQDSYQVCKEVPAFQVRDDGEGDWMVRISPPKEPHNVCLRAFKGNWLALESFIQAALTKKPGLGPGA